MELNKAIKILKENRDVAKHRADGLEKNKLTDFLDIQYKIDKEDYEAIDTVLTELDRLQKAKEEMTAEEFLRMRDMECIKYEECDDKCKFKRRGECVALCRIAVQIAKEIKEGNNEQV